MEATTIIGVWFLFQALDEEKLVYERSSSKSIYLNVAVNTLKKLRGKSCPSPSPSNSPYPQFMHSRNNAMIQFTSFPSKLHKAKYASNVRRMLNSVWGRYDTYFLKTQIWWIRVNSCLFFVCFLSKSLARQLKGSPSPTRRSWAVVLQRRPASLSTGLVNSRRRGSLVRTVQDHMNACATFFSFSEIGFRLLLNQI